MKFLSAYRSLALVLLLLCVADSTMANERRLLLITKLDYTPQPLDTNELRRLFLGMKVYRDGKILLPLVNKSSDICYEIFLQSILGMSQKRYEHTLLSSLYRRGIKSPKIYTNQKKLFTKLMQQENAISFMFDYGDELESGINIVQEIWISEKP